ncbi:hypothetical protein TNCV_545931 [Trichonephila clavipes]|nr:hypothetical protein TNCV_545931 [Trichonephila clavipes]
MVNNLVYRTSTGTVILLLRILTGRPLRLRLENPDISCRVRRRIIGEKTASHRHLKIKEVGVRDTGPIERKPEQRSSRSYNGQRRSPFVDYTDV